VPTKSRIEMIGIMKNDSTDPFDPFYPCERKRR